MSVQRRDIQGLRGLAVVLIVLSNLPTPFSFYQGSIGLDIFFVITGYVMTRSLISKEDPGNSHWRQYSRFVAERVLILLPSLAVMIVGALILSVVLAPPPLLHQIAESALFSQGFLSNFHFVPRAPVVWNPEIPVLPLSHLWSLGIHLQVVLLLPLLIVKYSATENRTRDTNRIVQGLLSCSFASTLLYAHVLLTPDNSLWGYFPANSAHYFFGTQFWKFGVGAMVALLAVDRVPDGLKRLLGVPAWLLVGTAIFFAKEASLVSVYSIPLTIGIAMLLILGEKNMSWGNSKVMALPPLVWLGNCSYSIFLWHVPLIAVSTWLFPGKDSELGAFLALGLVIAVISHGLFVRKHSEKTHPVIRTTVPVMISCAVATACLVISTSDWFAVPEQLSPSQLTFPDSSKPPGEVGTSLDSCQMGDYEIHCKNFPAVTKEIVIIGDSLAFRAFPAVQLAAREHGLNASMFWNGGCGIELNSCRTRLVGNLVYNYLSKADVYGLIIASNFDRESNRVNAIERDLNLAPLCDPLKSTSSCPLHVQRVKSFEISARLGLQQLSVYSDNVFVGLPFPQQAELPPKCSTKPLYARIFSVDDNGEMCGKTSVEWQIERQGLYPASITRVANQFPNVQSWNPLDYMCFDGWCPSVLASGEQVMSDGIHWNLDASRFLYPAFDAFMDRTQTKESTRP